MAVKNNPVLGSVHCSGCSGEATVHQTSRGKARYLYTRCAECGPDQRTGKAVQAHLWASASWRPGMKPETAPPGVEPPKDWQPGQPKPTEKAQPEQPKPEPEPAKPAGKGGQVLGGLFGLGLIAISGGALYFKARASTR